MSKRVILLSTTSLSSYLNIFLNLFLTFYFKNNYRFTVGFPAFCAISVLDDLGDDRVERGRLISLGEFLIFPTYFLHWFVSKEHQPFSVYLCLPQRKSFSDYTFPFSYPFRILPCIQCSEFPSCSMGSLVFCFVLVFVLFLHLILEFIFLGLFCSCFI